ncbi:MAG: tRNA lysidine(34) synthetase TilS, partial [Anaerolineales bacterium]
MRLDNIANILSRQCGLTKDHPVVVGVSGGADSLALMHAMFSLGYDLIIAHLDHALRPESSREADFVKSLAAARGLPFISARIDVKAEAEKTGNSLEEAARNVRYRFLFDCARKAQAQAVAVAHHADDQVETILMHFIRGAARSGLAGMPYRRLLLLWDSEIPLVRPLLDVWRTEINTYVSSAGLKPRIDLSNQDTTYFRNRLRHELIPEMETYNPEFRKVLLRTADVFRMEKTLLDDLAKEVWRKCLISKSNEQVILKITPFKQSHKALQRRVLRQAI